jgi:hypothetical protein
MSRTAFILMLALLLAGPARAEGELRHGLVSAALTSALYLTMNTLTGREKKTKGPNLVAAILMTVSAGVALEAMQSMQRRDRRLDQGDIAANLVGSMAATGLILAIDF